VTRPLDEAKPRRTPVGEAATGAHGLLCREFSIATVAGK
jgi:hypothetical protein